MNTQPLRADGGIEAVIRQYQSMIYGLAFAKTGSAYDADDVFQEVFLAYFKAGKTFREEEHRKAWLLRTTLNMARRVTQSTYRKKVVPLEEGESMSAPFREEPENELWRALQAMAEGYRLPIYLFYFEELSTQEIADVLGLRPGAVRTRLSRGREQLRQTLKGAYFDE